MQSNSYVSAYATTQTGGIILCASTLSAGCLLPFLMFFGCRRWPCAKEAKPTKYFFITSQCSRFHGSMTKYFTALFKKIVRLLVCGATRKMLVIHNLEVYFSPPLYIPLRDLVRHSVVPVNNPNLSFVTVKNYQQMSLL